MKSTDVERARFAEDSLMLVTNLQTNLADPDFQPSSREERMAQQGRDRYREKQDVLRKRGAAADRDDYASQRMFPARF